MFTFGKEFLISSIKEIYERKFGHPLADNVVHEIEVSLSNLQHNDSDECESSSEVNDIINEEKIETIAHCIRMVIICYMQCLNEPYPYIIKKNLPLLKENHNMILPEVNSPFYHKITSKAYYDMFEGEFKLLDDNISDYISFFNQYTTNPTSLNLDHILNAIPPRYLPDIPNDLFSM